MLLLLISLVSTIAFSQKAKYVFSVRKNVHALNGIQGYDSTSFVSEKKTILKYGEEIIVLEYLPIKLEVNGYHGKWAKVLARDTVSFVPDIYLSDLACTEVDQTFKYMKDYFYDSFNYLEGDKQFKITESLRRREAKFKKGDYRFKGEDCYYYEEFNFSKRYSVQEVFVVLQNFNWNFHELLFNDRDYEKNEDGHFTTQYYKPSDFLTLDYLLSYRKNDDGEYTYLSAYFDCEAGGGYFTAEETSNSIKVTHEYGCH